MSTGVSVDFDATYLRDVLRIRDIHVQATWLEDKEYVSGFMESVALDISEDHVLDQIIVTLTDERARRVEQRLKADVERLERQHEQALATKDCRWGDWQAAEDAAFAKYKELCEAKAKLADREAESG